MKRWCHLAFEGWDGNFYFGQKPTGLPGNRAFTSNKHSYKAFTHHVGNRSAFGNLVVIMGYNPVNLNPASMKSTCIKLCVIIYSFAIISCQKETSGTSATGDISGNYNFISMKASTRSTNQSGSGVDIVKTVTSSNYVTENNSGTVTLDAANFTTTNITYSVNTVAKGSYYENNVLIDTFSLPFQFTAPASSGKTTYVRVNADSIYFQSGSIFMGGSSQASLPSGARIQVENGNLILTSNFFQTSTTIVQGESIAVIIEGSTVATLKRR